MVGIFFARLNLVLELGPQVQVFYVSFIQLILNNFQKKNNY